MISEIKGISKSFGGLGVLDSVDLQIERQSIVGLIGPNGAGKTTLINIITGLLPQDQGEIIFRGQNIENWKQTKRAKAGIGRVFQQGRLFNNMSVLENIMVGGHFLYSYNFLTALRSGRSFKKVESELFNKALDLAEKLGIMEYVHQDPAQLPYGIQRRVEIARALALDPKLLMLDEPTAGMNPVEAQTIMELLVDLQAQGISVLIVEHNIRLIMKICEKVVVLVFGKKIAEGTPDIVRNNEGVIEAYLGKSVHA